jgi:VanZ family protein
MYKILAWLAVVLWMALIFHFSHQPASASNQLSTGITASIVETVEKIFPNTEINVRGLNHIVRKNAHFFIYLVLGMLMINALNSHGIDGYRRILIALGVCMLYAASDEVHQIFIPGRGAQVRDVLIDSAGAFVGIGIALAIGLLLKTISR